MNEKDKKFIDNNIALVRLKTDFHYIVELMEIAVEQYPVYHKQMKICFDSLVKAGFSKQEALELVIRKGWGTF